MAAAGLIPEYRMADEKEDGGISTLTYMTQAYILKVSHILPFNEFLFIF